METIAPYKPNSRVLQRALLSWEGLSKTERSGPQQLPKETTESRQSLEAQYRGKTKQGTSCMEEHHIHETIKSRTGHHFKEFIINKC